MDMMYMPDALNAAISLMEADPKRLKHRNAFNIASMSFDPEEIYHVIKKYIPKENKILPTITLPYFKASSFIFKNLL